MTGAGGAEAELNTLVTDHSKFQLKMC